MKLSLAAGQQHDLQAALLSLGKSGSVDLHLPPTAGRVLHLQRPAATNLNAVVKDLRRRPGCRSPKLALG